MFEKLIAEIEQDAKNEKEKNKETVKIEVDNCVDRPETLIKNLKAMDTMNDKDAYDLIRNNYKTILSDIRYNFIKQNHKFITLLTQVTYDVSFSYEELISCNAFIYNYIVYKTEQDSYLRKLLLILGEAINKACVNKLLGQGIEQELAIFLAVANYSTARQEINIKRFNFTLATYSPILSIQKIIDIYTSLFNKSFSKLLVATIFDTTIQEASENGELWLNKEAVETDENMVWAVIYILESLPPQDITKYLYVCSETFKVAYDCNKENIRKSFHSLPSRLFRKIPIIVEQLEGLESDIIIP